MNELVIISITFLSAHGVGGRRCDVNSNQGAAEPGRLLGGWIQGGFSHAETVYVGGACVGLSILATWGRRSGDRRTYNGQRRIDKGVVNFIGNV